ncbi:hypothetical protein [uncultured Sulfitobacter sp.]|uniref:hypothetical protein n=1 Tax=uncultured Sulfitobacter sp. TaxID=191468 RepID=UPI002615637C|nr:hypothetical protein [uncultured Sulfitobacter sp.]
MFMKALFAAAALCGTPQIGAASHYECISQRLCANDAPGQQVSQPAKIPELRDTLLFSLEADMPVFLKKAETTRDVLLRSTSYDTSGQTSHMLTVFADLTLIYSTHTFVGQDVVVTGLGTCQRNRT